MRSFLTAPILFLLFSICSVTSSSAGAQFFDSSRFRFGTGVLSYDALKNTTEESAETSFLGQNYYLPLQAEVRFEWFSQKFSPKVLYTPIAVEAPDGGSRSTVLLFTVPWLYSVNDRWMLSAGMGYLLRTIKGDGGTVELGNGLGTSTFSLPGRTETTGNLTTEFGLTWQHRLFDVRLDSVFTSLLTERRSVSFLVTMNFGL